MKNAHAVIVTVALIALASASVFAQERNPTMTGQRNDAERENLYLQFSENKKIPNPDRQRLAYYAARDYIKRFNEVADPYISEMRKFVSAYEKVLKNFNVYSSYVDKKYLKTFELGREVLQKEPQNFYVLAVLAEAGFDNSQTGDSSLNNETLDYTRRALEMLAADRVQAPNPFATKEVARGVLNFILGWYLRPQSPIEAAVALTVAAQADSPYKTDALTYNLLGAAILKGEYAKMSAEYNEKFGNKPPSPEQQAMFAQLMKVGERAIDAYARAVALSTKPEQQEGRAKLLAQLTNLYKGFHNGSDAGLNDLIAGVLSKPMP